MSTEGITEMADPAALRLPEGPAEPRSPSPVVLRLERAVGEGGGVFRGSARAEAARVVVRLWWAARGRGVGRDWVEIVGEVEGDGPELTFELPIPVDAPVSFDGALVRVEWSVTARATIDGVEHAEREEVTVGRGPGAPADAVRAEREALHRRHVREEVAAGLARPLVPGLLAGAAAGLVLAGLAGGAAGAVGAVAVGAGVTGWRWWTERRGALSPSVRFAGPIPVVALGQRLRIEVETQPGRRLFWRLGWTEAVEEIEVELRRGSRVEHRRWREHRVIVQRGEGLVDVHLPEVGPSQLVRDRHTVAWWVEIDEAEGERAGTVVVPVAVVGSAPHGPKSDP